MTAGGLGVAGKAYVGGMLVVTGDTAATTKETGAIISYGGMGVAQSIYSGGQLVASIDNTVANAVTDVLVLKHSTDGTAANGIGVGISIGIEDAGGDGSGVPEAASVDFVMTDVQSGSEDAEMEIKLMAGGTMTSTLVATGLTVGVTAVTPATDAVTGALTVAGGAGVT